VTCKVLGSLFKHPSRSVLLVPMMHRFISFSSVARFRIRIEFFLSHSVSYSHFSSVLFTSAALPAGSYTVNNSYRRHQQYRQKNISCSYEDTFVPLTILNDLRFHTGTTHTHTHIIHKRGYPKVSGLSR
jgi:hypothetical protein